MGAMPEVVPCSKSNRVVSNRRPGLGICVGFCMGQPVPARVRLETRVPGFTPLERSHNRGETALAIEQRNDNSCLFPGLPIKGAPVSIHWPSGIFGGAPAIN